jgi:sec-independent protein translocase protein TatA
MGEMSPWHWAIVILVLVVLFGSKRLPSAARSLGQSLRIFTSEMKEMHADPRAATTNPPTTPGSSSQRPPAQPVPTTEPTGPDVDFGRS